MASSSTLKSQPLHNFQLHDLKWAMNHPTNHRFRKLSDSFHKSPQRGDTESESDNNRKANPVCEAPSENVTGKSERKFVNGSDVLVDCDSEKKANPSDGRSNIYIRVPAKNQKPVDEVADVAEQSLIAEDIEELVPKTWNLRPRKPNAKPPNHNESATKNGGSAPENETHRLDATRSRNVTEPKPAEKKVKKQKLSISLSREEIDEDLFAMTGSKASRRPKKRAKSVQKQLDCVFPGLWLASITPDWLDGTAAKTVNLEGLDGTAAKTVNLEDGGI
ncbi:putative Mitochondrial transcription termination factor family protein [Hibiscus syriacus]|uniref:Mitochondrial transcription termination factor family protein n=1 Tax=Hibiscus syriacus TaxID=106335 RepID=A0A6A3A2U5_HIBSY|nr:putative Mitochondrial transcription termination factor family protein [Hibiscus syriacus]